MKSGKALIFLFAASFVFMATGYSFAQQQPKIVEGGAVPQAQQDEVQWLWGEVLTVDTQNKNLLVKYLDYEVDQEKEISISVDEKTTYENIKSFQEIKPKDALSIDYIVTPQGKNIAKNISMENSRDLPPEAEGPAMEETAEVTAQDMGQDAGQP